MAKPALLLLFLAISLILLPAPRLSSAQPAYFQPCAVTQLGANGANQIGDVTTTFGIGLDTSTCTPFASSDIVPNEYNFDQLVFFTPPEWHVATDAEIPDGQTIGSIGIKISLGLFNSSCNTAVSIPTTLFEATTSSSETVAPFGPDPLHPMSDINFDGIPEAAVKWPTYLDGVALRSQVSLSALVSRYVGVDTTPLLGSTTVYNVLVFSPGTSFFGHQVDARLGYPVMIVVNDPSARATPQGLVNDFCAPLWLQLTVSGEVNSVAARHDPPDGVYDFVTYVLPQPDADGDGIENRLDVCPTQPNISGWDPHGPNVQNPGDADGDGLPDDCDPVPTEKSLCNSPNTPGADEDCDSWGNRADNCPLVANLDQSDSDADGIGDACDPQPQTVQVGTPVCLVSQVTIGSGGSAPADPYTMSPCDASVAPVLTGDLNCDQLVNNADLLTWLKDWAGIAAAPCRQALPAGCDDPQAYIPYGILSLLAHVADSASPILTCPMA